MTKPFHMGLGDRTLTIAMAVAPLGLVVLAMLRHPAGMVLTLLALLLCCLLRPFVALLGLGALAPLLLMLRAWQANEARPSSMPWRRRNDHGWR